MPAPGIESVRTFIRERMVLRALPFRPDISIAVPTPQSGINAWLASEGHDDTPPYWAYAWAGGSALALYLRDNPEVVARRAVLDFGAGSGLAGIAAGIAGAEKVLALEPDPVARIALQLNGEANGIDLTLWTAADLPAVDVVLAGDVFYAPEIVARTLPALSRLAEMGATVLIGDPYRHDLPGERLKHIRDYDVPDMGGGAPVRSGIFELRRDMNARHIGNAP